MLSMAIIFIILTALCDQVEWTEQPKQRARWASLLKKGLSGMNWVFHEWNPVWKFVGRWSVVCRSPGTCSSTVRLVPESSFLFLQWLCTAAKQEICRSITESLSCSVQKETNATYLELFVQCISSAPWTPIKAGCTTILCRGSNLLDFNFGHGSSGGTQVGGLGLWIFTVICGKWLAIMIRSAEQLLVTYNLWWQIWWHLRPTLSNEAWRVGDTAPWRFLCSWP